MTLPLYESAPAEAEVLPELEEAASEAPILYLVPKPQEEEAVEVVDVYPPPYSRHNELDKYTRQAVVSTMVELTKRKGPLSKIEDRLLELDHAACPVVRHDEVFEKKLAALKAAFHDIYTYAREDARHAKD
ncbi:MAG: hypothetical protein JWN38_59 [Candidatus Saccharibacteria bacterium]|nr:hypothetical protein [Candidatus Saccharibacteria bacterium]